MSPFIVVDRAPTGMSSAWILPGLYASLAILALTFLFWPVSWLVRRHHKTELAVAGRARQAYRATRVFAGLSLAVLIGWLLVVAVLFEKVSSLNKSSDFLLWVLQIGGAVVFVGAVIVSAWNVWLTFTDGRRWTRKLWSVLILLATLLVLYVAFTFGLLSMSVNY